jgi:hypothetical protein
LETAILRATNHSRLAPWNIRNIPGRTNFGAGTFQKSFFPAITAQFVNGETTKPVKKQSNGARTC